VADPVRVKVTEARKKLISEHAKIRQWITPEGGLERGKRAGEVIGHEMEENERRL
jgi:hypothetical protein